MRLGDVKRKGGDEIYIRLGTSRCRSEDDIKMDLNGMRWAIENGFIWFRTETTHVSW